MMLFGKKVTIKDYKFTFGNREKEFYIFACFKYHSEIFTIYADAFDTENKLYYGSAHITNDVLVVLSTNDVKEIEGIKSFIVKLINNQDIGEFEIISLDKVDKIEIIGANNFVLKKEIIDKLVELTIPKEVEKKEDVVLVNKSSSDEKKYGKYVTLIFIIIFAFVGIFLYLNRETFFGNKRQVICTKQLADEYNASVNQTILFYFNNKDVLVGYTMTNLYTFNNDKDYQDFSLTGRYFHIFDVSSDKLNLVPNVENRTYQVGYTMNPLVDYFGPKEYYDVFDYYETDGYNCNNSEE